MGRYVSPTATLSSKRPPTSSMGVSAPMTRNACQGSVAPTTPTVFPAVTATPHILTLMVASVPSVGSASPLSAMRTLVWSPAR